MKKTTQRKDKIVWFGVTAVLVLFLTLAVFVPSVLAQSRESGTDDYLETFGSVFNYVYENYVDEVDPNTLFEGALSGLFESLDDPYSTYLTASDMQDLSDTTSGKFGGVGLYITKPSRSEIESNTNGASPYVRVVAPIEGTPATRAGITAGDYITKIEGESTIDLTIDEVVERLRGTPGSQVRVTLLRREKITFEVVLTRDIIEVPTIRHAMIHGSIGYLRIIQFTPYTDDKVAEAIDGFKRNGYTAVIIDVRNNPGGLLNAVVDTCDLFLSSGTIVSTRSRIPSENKVFTARRRTEVDASIPVVVLIDRGSASASEILAGAFKDRSRGYLLGEKSFGKGSVQQVKSFGAGGFKLTTSRYYTPSGINIDKIGISPDKEVKEPELTDEETESYRRLIEENLIPQFAKENPSPTGSEIDTFVMNIKKDGILLEERILKRLIRNELNKTNNNPPVFDLEFDIVLNEAVRMIEAGEVSP